MQIINHRLCLDDGTAYPYVELPKAYYGWGVNKPIVRCDYLVIHFTSMASAAATVNGFKSRTNSARVSAHLVIDTDGGITQCVPFDIIAHHAGSSQWAGLTGINFYSIGIELANLGDLAGWKKQDEQMVKGTMSIPVADTISAKHRLEYATKVWQKFPEAQIQALTEVGKLLASSYNILDVVGHEDVSTVGKIDPGPAFPMAEYRVAVLNLDPSKPEEYRTTGETKLRKYPSDEIPVEIVDTMRGGVLTQISERKMGWVRVLQQDPIGDWVPVKGWMRERYLRRERVTAC